ncbi:MAG: hypothetical protein M0R80_11535 [Proteobacteria bacterium]|jgi:hypothetical protein|nr:hypothetical protein [Pseudomonadota bacterium]
MKYLTLYLLFGAMVAVWSAINAQRANLASMLPAYALVAILWPLSLAVSVLSLVVGLSSGRSNREGKEQGR